MSQALAKVGMVAGVVALVATGVGAAAGAGLLAAKGSATAIAIAATAKSVATYATLAAITANVGAQLTASKPSNNNGVVNKTTIGAELPRPYLMGQTFYAGTRRHWIGYGGKVDKVENPYLLMIDVYSCGGPLDGLVVPYLDYVPIPMSGNAALGYAGGNMWVYNQLGATPEPSALPTRWTGAPGWGPSSKLSGYAALSWNLLFDKDGKKFAAGIPATGAEWRGVKAYDPRKDSTYPGGSGPHRWADPADKVAFAAAKQTWEWTVSPALHALRYALGTWERDETNPSAPYQKTFGIGLPIESIRVQDFVALANICQANGWRCDGVIFEPGNKDDNLKRILQAGGAERCWINSKLGLKLSAPRVPLDTITEDDLASDDVEVGAMQGWEQRINTLTPKFRSGAHKWEYVSSEPVQIAAQVEEDGGIKADERQYDLVQFADQAAQLAAYELMDARELGEIVLRCKPRLRRYGAGDLLIVDLPDDGLNAQPCVVLKRTFDPVQMTVELILRGETMGKHAYALGRTGTAPPTPALGGTEGYDVVVPENTPASLEQLLIANSYPIGLTISASDAGDGTATITTSAHSRVYQDRTVAVDAATITSVALSTTYWLYMDDAAREGGALSLWATTTYADAFTSSTNPARHYIGSILTPAAGGGSSSGGGGTPPGGGSTNPIP
nr:hypothetical protein [uncultured Sphingomonas sp.]